MYQKLGIKAGMRMAVLQAPPDYLTILEQDAGDHIAVPPLAALASTDFDFIHYFTKTAAELAENFDSLKSALAFSGMLWISWPKKASKIPTDLTEDSVRAIGLTHGLVDVKVVAVDEVWSGLKFVFRKADRPR